MIFNLFLFPGVRISSDLDTDTEVDAGVFGSSKKPEDDFDFYDWLIFLRKSNIYYVVYIPLKLIYDYSIRPILFKNSNIKAKCKLYVVSFFRFRNISL